MTVATARTRLASSGYDSLRDRLTGGIGAADTAGDVLYRARHACYLVLGFDDEQAFRLAVSPESSVSRAARLVELGCGHDTVLRILG